MANQPNREQLLDVAETELMGRLREHAERTKELIKEVHLLNSVRFQTGEAKDGPELAIATGESTRWAAIAKTQLQQGYMALERAIALPSTF